jgi:hypothetical protein
MRVMSRFDVRTMVAAARASTHGSGQRRHRRQQWPGRLHDRRLVCLRGRFYCAAETAVCQAVIDYGAVATLHSGSWPGVLRSMPINSCSSSTARMRLSTGMVGICSPLSSFEMNEWEVPARRATSCWVGAARSASHGCGRRSSSSRAAPGSRRTPRAPTPDHGRVPSWIVRPRPTQPGRK